MTVQNAKVTGSLVGGATAAGVARGLCAPGVDMRRMLNRRRYAQWDAEQDLVEAHGFAGLPQ
ncbi:hypothetical protein [Streptomyces gibsoniae]|uniref:Uncharacterized protein n=1 Tax=Streptomyces gibsoniae TaxID=3075529 RepID=A0ABU2U2U3_9ACTN|nr:hypothetical protein [Streptomyces sp. DSM 41699]MDT0467425.1 hypothetical protein [Streptomyces sp. DSM 41699]